MSTSETSSAVKTSKASGWLDGDGRSRPPRSFVWSVAGSGGEGIGLRSRTPLAPGPNADLRADGNVVSVGKASDHASAAA